MMPKRASFRHDSGALSPMACGSRFFSGTRTSLRLSSAVTDARRDILERMV
ncbi:Uncharacterised protein [Mycobacteroides abscessus subsp. massiliense]|nr:Uncharacterised protein [Mycobacteroides abscessus subsp. massiliense]